MAFSSVFTLVIFFGAIASQHMASARTTTEAPPQAGLVTTAAHTCTQWTFDINMGNLTCSTTANHTSDNYGAMCLRSQLGELITQGCDGMPSGETICSDWGSPTTCCQIPFTGQKIICGADMTTQPTKADFATCSTTCVASAQTTIEPPPQANHTCTEWAFSFNMGNLTCSTTAKHTSDNYGAMCLRSQFEELITQGCDGMTSGETICSDWGSPTTCCQIPFTGQKIICGSDMTTQPTEADFATCSTTCQHGGISGAMLLSTGMVQTIVVTLMCLFNLFV